MGADASIYNNVGRFKSKHDFDNEAAAGKLNALRLMSAQSEYDQGQAGIRDQNALRSIVSGFGQDDEANANALFRGGRLKEAQDYRQASLDAQAKKGAMKKTDAEADKARLANGLQKFEIIGQLMGGVRDQGTYDFARQKAAAHFGPEFADKMDPVYDPAKIEQNRQQAMSVKERMEQEWKQKGYDRQITNDQENVRQFGVTDARIRSEGAANRGVQVRGQNMVDGRARESTSATMSKPFEVTGPDGVSKILVQQDKQGNIRPVQGFGPKGVPDKPLTEVQANATTFVSRMRDSSGTLNALEDNVGRLDTEAAKSTWTNWLASPKAQQYQQARRNWITANLRKESGAAIPENELENEYKKWFPVIGDAKSNIEQKRQSRKVAEEAMLVQSGPGASKVEGILERGGSPATKPAVPSGTDLGGGFRVK